MQTQTVPTQRLSASRHPPEGFSQEMIRDHITHSGFPCVGAKTALAKQQIQICPASSILSDHDDAAILEGLYRFIADYERDQAIFRSFIVVFHDRQREDREGHDAHADQDDAT